MKTTFLRLSLLLFAIGLLLGSCNNQKSKKETTVEQQNVDNPAYTSAYVCPMHCEGSGDEQPGKCPVCGMEYVKNENHPKPHQH